MKKFQAIIKFTMDDQFMTLVPPHRSYINFLFNKSIIDSYAVSMESQTCWITLNTDSKEAAAKYTEYAKAGMKLDAEIQATALEIGNKVNGMFHLVEFKMFETLVSGEIKDCCTPTIAGVPYSDANTASKINAGIDISNTVSRFFDKEMITFVDNIESVEKLMPSNNQIIACKFIDDDLKISEM